MRRNLVFYFLCFFLLALDTLSAQQTTGSKQTEIPGKGLHPDAPRETKMLSQLFGVWDAYQVKRNRDGTWASDTTRSEWRWYSILEGHAIQDDWIKFEATNGSAQTPQVVGTNIRIYNSSENQWHMAWIDKTNRRLATFTARNENNTVIMSGKNAQGRQIRNTFFNLSKDEFDWKQEWTFDGGNSWVEVSKIHCKRQNDKRSTIRPDSVVAKQASSQEYQISVVDPELIPGECTCVGQVHPEVKINETGLRPEYLQKGMPCIAADFDGNGIIDYALPGSEGFVCVIMNDNNGYWKSISIDAEGVLELYPPRDSIGENGEPRSQYHSLLVRWVGLDHAVFVWDGDSFKRHLFPSR